jgi:membrane protein DedA with SNARE-associated domain
LVGDTRGPNRGNHLGTRILAAPVASAGGVGYAKFLVFDVAGALLWSGTFTLLGYALGAQRRR